MANLSEKADHAWQKEMLRYMATYNAESQVLAIDGSNAENIQTTGTKTAYFNGTPVTLAADAELDISADTTGDAAGATIASGKSRWFTVLAASDGTLSVWLSGDAATDGSEVLEVPDFNPETYVCVGFIHVNSNTTFVLGTTALTTIGTFYQAVGPVFPHPKNLNKAGAANS